MAQKKNDNSEYRALRMALKDGAPECLYVFHGEEHFRMESALKKLREQLTPDGLDTFNYHAFDGKNLDVRELVETMDGLPMMSDRTLIVVTDFDLFGCNEDSKTLLTQAFSDLPDYLCLVFVYDLLDYKIGRGKFQDLVKKVGHIVEFTAMEHNELIDWIYGRFLALDKQITREECEYLIFLCGGLMTGLNGEIEKIAGYSKTSQITRTDIDAVADPVLEAQVFDMTGAISARDFSKALGCLADLYAANQHPIMILAVLGKHLRQLYTARLALESGKGTPALTEMWNMKSPWQANRLMSGARNLTLDWCRKAVRLAAEADLDMKSSGRDAQTILTELLLQLANS